MSGKPTAKEVEQQIHEDLAALPGLHSVYKFEQWTDEEPSYFQCESVSHELDAETLNGIADITRAFNRTWRVIPNRYGDQLLIQIWKEGRGARGE